MQSATPPGQTSGMNYTVVIVLVQSTTNLFRLLPRFAGDVDFSLSGPIIHDQRGPSHALDDAVRSCVFWNEMGRHF